MQELYDQMLEFAIERMLEGNKPLEVAAVLNTLSMSIYRSVLTEEDYQRMADAIRDNAEKIKPLHPFAKPKHTLQ